MTSVLTVGSEFELAAQDYAAHDWYVLPLAGKKPLKRLAPHAYKSASSEPDVIRNWWRDTPDANVGIACAPSGLVVIDADERAGGDELLYSLQLEHGPLPETPHAISGGGGTHDFLIRPAGRLKHELGSGVEVLDKGHVVAPPSIHPKTGRRYAWEIDHKIPLAPAPDPWLDLLRWRQADRRYRLEGTIPNGRRNDTLTHQAGAMRRAGLTTDEILGALVIVNKHRCETPLPAGEVARIAKSIGKRATAPPWALDAAGFVAPLPLAPTAKHVLIQLCHRAKDDGTVIGGRWIDRETGLSQKAVWTALQSLRKSGIVRETPRLGRTNTYRIVEVGVGQQHTTW